MWMDTFTKRLDAALAGKAMSDRKASTTAGLHMDTIRMIRRGQEPRASAVVALARALDVSPTWLMGAEDTAPNRLMPDHIEAPDGVAIADYVPVREALAHFGAGGGGNNDIEGDGLGAPVLLPRDLIERDLRGVPEDFVVADVEGQSMEPVLMSGDRVLIDRRKTNPSQAGLFALWDGYGLVIKWLDRIRDGDDPPRLRVLSENARFAPYEVTADEISILGRVVWFARRL